MIRYLAILDTMWGVEGSAPHWFYINPLNHSGKRLYKLTHATLWQLRVTNACPQQRGAAWQHGTPSITWLHASFQKMPREWRTATLLVCGKVAQHTYHRMIEAHGRPVHTGPVYEMPHPASRTWTKAQLLRVEKEILRISR